MKNLAETSHKETIETGKWIKHSRLVPFFVALSLTLGACSTPAEKIQHQRDKVNRLEQLLIQQSKNYHEVAKQQNIQIDLREEWADQTINQEIGYATEWALDYDEKIKKTKEKLAKEQRELDEMEEKYGIPTNSSTPIHWRLKQTKYDYIPEEYNRSRGN